jgi:hypothetical protein
VDSARMIRGRSIILRIPPGRKPSRAKQRKFTNGGTRRCVRTGLIYLRRSLSSRAGSRVMWVCSCDGVDRAIRPAVRQSPQPAGLLQKVVRRQDQTRKILILNEGFLSGHCGRPVRSNWGCLSRFRICPGAFTAAYGATTHQPGFPVRTAVLNRSGCHLCISRSH